MSSLIRMDASSLNVLANSIGNVALDLSTPYPTDVSACQSQGVASTLAHFAEQLEAQRLVLQEHLQALADGVIATANDFAENDATLTAEFNRVLPEIR